MIRSNKLYSPQNYLELVTGNYYIDCGDDDVNFVEKVLDENNLHLQSYPLNEIKHIIENKLDVVLVCFMIYNEDKRCFERILRWIEVPEGVDVDG